MCPRCQSDSGLGAGVEKMRDLEGYPAMAALMNHAERELALIGEDIVTTEKILYVVEAFAEIELTGAASVMATEYLHQLLRRKPLSPLTNDPSEWERRENATGAVVWQSARDPEAFSEDGGKTYWLLSDPPSVSGGRPTIWTSADKADVTRPPNIHDQSKLEEN